jgi:ribosomal protein S18 acetylase RimI-like enzyme
MSKQIPGEWLVARASAADAEAMAAVYREVYPAGPGLPPGSGYPFPQYMSADGLACSLGEDQYRWLIAKCGQEVIGCVGAATCNSLPGSDDRVAELTGLVVSTRWRGRGIGQSLVRSMCRELEDAGALFLLAETRTGNLGGWKATVRAGFIPIGFEPFAHNMLGRQEHMIMMGKVLPAACERRTLNYQTSAVAQRLGSVCLRLLGQPAPPSRSAAPCTPVFTESPIVEQTTSTSIEAVCPALTGHSGIVGLRRIRGLNQGELRFLDRYYRIRQQKKILGVAHVTVDLQDRRARILRLEVEFDGLQACFLQSILGHLQNDEFPQPLACAVVDVRADFASLHASLATMGFFPSVYYPAFLAAESGRVDAVQFTRLLCDDLDDRSEPLNELGPDLTQIVRIVLAARDEARDPAHVF